MANYRLFRGEFFGFSIARSDSPNGIPLLATSGASHENIVTKIRFIIWLGSSPPMGVELLENFSKILAAAAAGKSRLLK